MAVHSGTFDEVGSQKTVPFDQNLAILTGITAAGDLIPVLVDPVTGKLIIDVSIGSVTIDAVGIHDATSTSTKAVVKTDGTDNALVVMQNLGNTVATAAVAIGFSTAAVVLALNTSRKSFSIQNYGSKTAFIGESAVTAASGFPLIAGATYSTDDFSGAVYAICAASDTTTIRTFDITRA